MWGFFKKTSELPRGSGLSRSPEGALAHRVLHLGVLLATNVIPVGTLNDLVGGFNPFEKY